MLFVCVSGVSSHPIQGLHKSCVPLHRGLLAALTPGALALALGLLLLLLLSQQGGCGKSGADVSNGRGGGETRDHNGKAACWSLDGARYCTSRRARGHPWPLHTARVNPSPLPYRTTRQYHTTARPHAGANDSQVHPPSHPHAPSPTTHTPQPPHPHPPKPKDHPPTDRHTHTHP